jgi:hypothetical protein
MKILRTRSMRRVASCFFLVIFIQSLFLPYYSFALTTGPHQPEYTSYESPGATDMVNLMTGDFSFSLPLLEVPGPEGNFAVPLAYNAGIGLDQEASWVGLGWSMNVGAITRAINEYPDDAAGEPQSITVQDLSGVRGWTSSVLGFGNIGWNTEVGHYGSISLFGIVNYSYDESGTTSVGLIGINVGDKGVTFDPVQFTTAVITIVSWGTAAAAAQGVSAATTIAKQAAIAAATNAVSSLVFSANTPNAPTAGYWKYKKDVDRRLFHKNYWIWLDQTRRERMYGALYLGKVPDMTAVQGGDIHLKVNGAYEAMYKYPLTSGTVSSGAASDINYYFNPAAEYYQSNNPASLALDNYSVKAAGISGSISPYRLDIGSVSMPRQMTANHVRYSPVRFLDYKVPFMYEGTASNTYFHHSGGTTAPTQPAFYNGGDMVKDGEYMNWELNDVIFKEERIQAAVNSTKKIAKENHVEWLSNQEIRSSLTYPSGFMDYFSGESPSGLSGSERHDFRLNAQLGTSAVPSSVFTSASPFQNDNIIPVATSDVAKFQVNQQVKLNLTAEDAAFTYVDNIPVTVTAVGANSITVSFNSSLVQFYSRNVDVEIVFFNTPQIQEAIGGYCITSADGTSYHFALPVYDYDMYTESVKATDASKRSIIRRTAPFANTWLLTSITGSDFIDRNSNGLVDDGDWGFWVKFNYGKYHNDFQWRLPFSGTKKSPDNAYNNFSHGYKQMYYLNTIETRSHVALFSKSIRSDSRSANAKNSLKLDEIILLSREHYKKLTSTLGLPNYSNKVDNVCTSFTAAQRSFINAQCLKRIQFTYGYDLCKNTPNSTDTNKGKLTLNRISLKGRSDVKTVPDYIFQYANNPDYSQHGWDGWGFYNGTGNEHGMMHKTNESLNGDAWCLSKIVTPLGSEVEMAYERDTYSSISGNTVEIWDQALTYSNSSFSMPVNDAFTIIPCTPGSAIQLDDYIRIEGDAMFTCPQTGTSVSLNDYVSQHRVVGKTATSLMVDGNYIGLPGSCSSLGSGNLTFQFNSGTIYKQRNNKKGGDIRVTSITHTNEFAEQNKIRYIYDNANGTSTGVVAQEPEYIKTSDLPFYNIPGYPMTPVIYGSVTVLTGVLQHDGDYHTRHIYNFETPHSSQLTVSKVAVKPRQVIIEYDDFAYGYMGEIFQHNITDRTSKIGSLKSIIVSSNPGGLVSQTNLEYTDQLVNNGVNNYQGIYSEGVLMADLLDQGYYSYNKLNRTTTHRYPYAIKKITTTKDGFAAESQNLSWNFISGQVDQKLDKNAQGLYVKTVTKPAFTVPEYAELGPKAVNISNRNMLAQGAATYVYKSNASGAQISLISAGAETWRKDWNNYRYYNGTDYVDANEAESQARPVWRRAASYAWKGNPGRLLADGSHTFSVSDEYSFANGTSNSLWEFIGETQRFDHFSMPLEVKDFNGQFTALKLGYDNKIKIAEALNAKFTEIAFSSAEDKIPSISFFGGEVGIGSGTVLYKSKGQTTTTHTGDAVVSLASGYSFVYKTSGITANKTYRASAWANSANGRIYYKLNGGTETLSVAPTTATKAGNWYRIDVLIPVGAATSIEVGVKSASGTVLFDDFRFQPADATMNCYVFNPMDFEFSTDFNSYTYVLDNDNMFTLFVESADGLLSRTYRETFKFGGVEGYKQVSENRSDYRRFHIGQ